MKKHLAPVLAAVIAVAAFPSPVGADARVGHAAGHASKKTSGTGTDAGEPPTEFLATLVQTHTDERVLLTETGPTQERFAELLRDRTTGSKHDFDPLLMELLRMLARKYPAARIELVSGFRSPKLNEMMRKKGHHVASHSQHTMGHAVDFRVEGLTVGDLVREVEARKWDGGLGRYDLASDLFIHVDVGPNRRWKGK